MNENVNSPVKWLRNLLYVGIAAAVNSHFGSYLLGGLAGWLGIAISAASVYLLFRLRDANPRYQTAAIFSAVAFISIRIGGTLLALVGLVCDLVAQYQEYHGHSELVEERDSLLAGKWNSLFWLQFVGALVLGALAGLISVVVALISGAETAEATTLSTMIASILSLALQALYLVYLHRTVKKLENEFVM